MRQRKIDVVSYQNSWPVDFEHEKCLLESVLTSSNLVQIHHIGSTAVEGLCAKPIIDILIEVESLAALDVEAHAMQSVGYICKGEFGIPDRRYYYKGGAFRTHHVHAFETNSQEVRRHLVFRDYLRHFPLVAMEYGKLKQRVAIACNNDIDRYGSHKHEFIQHTEARALAWANKCLT